VFVGTIPFQCCSLCLSVLFETPFCQPHSDSMTFVEIISKNVPEPVIYDSNGITASMEQRVGGRHMRGVNREY
jgi:hypothetical protein